PPSMEGGCAQRARGCRRRGSDYAAGASACASGAARLNASSFAQAPSIAAIVGYGANDTSKRRALYTCGIRQQSASVGVSPSQNFPECPPDASTASIASKPILIQCLDHAVFCASSAPSSR